MARPKDWLQDLLKEVRAEWTAWLPEQEEIRKVADAYRGSEESGRNRYVYPLFSSMAESAQAQVAPPDMKFTLARNPADPIQEAGAAIVPLELEKWLNAQCRTQNWIAEFRRTVAHSLITGRAVLHVDSLNKSPRLIAADYAEVFWPRHTRRPQELSWVASRQLVRSRYLKKMYPDRAKEITEREDAKKMVAIFTITDLDDRANVVVFQAGDQDTPPLSISSGRDFWNPWVFAIPVDDGESMRGLAPFRLALLLFRRLNQMLVRWSGLVDLQVPSFMLNTARVDEKDAAKIQAARPGDVVPVSIRPAEEGGAAELFIRSPEVTISPEIPALFNLLQQLVYTVTGSNALARSQMTGAKLATEVALMDANMRGLAKAREAVLGRGMTEAAAKVLALHTRRTSQADIDAITSVLDVSAASSSEQNRGILQQQFQAALPLIRGNPNFDQVALDKLVAEMYQLPETLFTGDSQEDPAAIAAALQSFAAAAQATGDADLMQAGQVLTTALKGKLPEAPAQASKPEQAVIE